MRHRPDFADPDDLAVAMETGTRCLWWRPGFAVGTEAMLIPMCMGAAVHGPEGCTCHVPRSRVERAERARANLEAEVARLLEKLDRAGDRIAVLIDKEARLRRQLAEVSS